MLRLFVATFILITSLNIGAQDTEMFYLNFFIEEVTETETESIVTAKLVNTTVKYDTAWEGSVVAIKANPPEIGKVKFTHFADGGNPMVEIRIPKEVDPASYMRYDGSGLLKIKVNSPSIPTVKQSLIYELYRLEINVYSTLDNISRHLLRGIKTYEEDKFSADDYYIPDLVKESATVAKAMRGNMESSIVPEGRFKGMDLFSAMEKSNYWDVQNFLKFMIDHYRVFQGKLGSEWKFSEIYATWIMDGAKGYEKMSDEQLKMKLREKLLENEHGGVKIYFERELVRGIDRWILKELCQDFRAESEYCIEHGVHGAYGLFVEAQNLAEYLDDKKELAWCYYLHGEESSDIDNFDFSMDEYKDALTYFKETDNKMGLAKVYSGMANCYRLLKTNSDNKKALGFYKKALEQSESFNGNEKVTDPLMALIYLNMGISHLGLKSTDKAEIALKQGLEYANAENVLGYKRKASLEAKLSEVYQMLGDDSRQQEYEGKAAESKNLYLAELDHKR